MHIGMPRAAWLLLVAVATFATEARADKGAAKRHYERGTRAYNLGRFDRAVRHFEQAYEAHPAPVFLFNIAQAHRLAGHCDKATFFYRRYLSADPDTRARAEIEDHLAELAPCAEERARDADAAAGDATTARGRAPHTTAAERTTAERSGARGGAPENRVTPGPRGAADSAPTAAGASGGAAPGPSSGGAPAPNGASGAAPGSNTSVSPPSPPRGPSTDGDPHATASTSIRAPRDAVVEARFEGGAAFLLLGDLDVPVQGAASVTAGHPIRFDRFAITVGAFADLTSVPYEGASSGTALLFAFGLGADARYFLVDRVALRAGAGLGVLLLSGLDAGNPITRGGNPTDGALSMFAMRGQLGVDVFLNDHVALAFTPLSVGFSPRRDDLADAVQRVLRVELVGGLAIFL